MKPFYKTTEFWLCLLSIYFAPIIVVGYNISRGLAKRQTPYKNGFLATELYLSLLAIYLTKNIYIAVAIIISYLLARGLSKAAKPHNAQIHY